MSAPPSDKCEKLLRQAEKNRARVKAYRERHMNTETESQRWCSACKRMRDKTIFKLGYKTCDDHHLTPKGSSNSLKLEDLINNPTLCPEKKPPKSKPPTRKVKTTKPTPEKEHPKIKPPTREETRARLQKSVTTPKPKPKPKSGKHPKLTSNMIYEGYSLTAAGRLMKNGKFVKWP